MSMVEVDSGVKQRAGELQLVSSLSERTTEKVGEGAGAAVETTPRKEKIL